MTSQGKALEDRVGWVFCQELVMQCRFVLLAAAQLEDSVNTRPAFDSPRYEQSMTDARAYLRTHPHDHNGYRALLAGAEEDQRSHMSSAPTWLALQSMLVSAANISKLLWGSGGKRAAEREVLRELTQVDDSSPLKDPDLRNDFEHIDERLLKIGDDPRVGYFARSIGHAPDGLPPGNKLDNVEREPHQLFGHFDPITMMASFWEHEVDLRAVIAEVKRILPLAEQASRHFQ